MNRTAPLERRTPLKRSSSKPRRRPISQASEAQRAKVRGERCVACGALWMSGRSDPAHLAARAKGGCDDPLCVVPLCRICHRSFDDGKLDILPKLVPHYAEELGHALVHYGGDLLALLYRTTAEHYTPEAS